MAAVTDHVLRHSLSAANERVAENDSTSWQDLTKRPTMEHGIYNSAFLLENTSIWKRQLNVPSSQRLCVCD